MFRIGIQADSKCPRCGRTDAHLMHMLCDCSELRVFWTEVLDLVKRVHGLQLSPSPRTCNLGILDTLDSDSQNMLSISRMLFQSWKLVAQHWIRLVPPSIREYVCRMNNIIRLEKAVYVKRNAHHKFEALWGPWLDTPGLPSPILLLNRFRLPAWSEVHWYSMSWGSHFLFVVDYLLPKGCTGRGRCLRNFSLKFFLCSLLQLWGGGGCLYSYSLQSCIDVFRLYVCKCGYSFSIILSLANRLFRLLYSEVWNFVPF